MANDELSKYPILLIENDLLSKYSPTSLMGNDLLNKYFSIRLKNLLLGFILWLFFFNYEVKWNQFVFMFREPPFRNVL